MSKVQFYKCTLYSLHEYLEHKGFKYISQHTNKNNYKYWIYQSSDAFMEEVNKFKSCKIYYCYSLNLLNYLQIVGHKPFAKHLNKKTGKYFWSFLVDEAVSECLDTWTQQKNN